MIIQSGNNPILIKFSENIEDIKNLRITLWQDKILLKEWTKENLEINEDVATANLSQEETKEFKAGQAELEIKWLEDDGITEFANKVVVLIIERNDKEVMVNA